MDADAKRVGSMRKPADNGGRGQKLAKSCGRLLWMAHNAKSGYRKFYNIEISPTDCILTLKVNSYVNYLNILFRH